jgi:cytochrome c peroxidase
LLSDTNSHFLSIGKGSVLIITAVINADTLKENHLLGLPVLSIPANNQQTAEKIALGRQLFNDKRLSQDGSISCASCHNQDRAFTDGQ